MAMVKNCWEKANEDDEKDDNSSITPNRVTQYFEELASGVNIEAYSIEDNGKLHFNVYVYSAQNKIAIDYATGESKLAK